MAGTIKICRDIKIQDANKGIWEIDIYILGYILSLSETFNNLEYVISHYILQIDDNEDKSDNLIGACEGICVVPNALNYDETLIPEEPDFFTAPYSGRKMDK